MNTVKAQGGTNSCDLSINNVLITKTAGPTTVGPDCSYTFNATFDIGTNSGFKYLFFHSWKQPDYVASFDCTKNGAANAPTAATLGTLLNTPGESFMDFGFINLNSTTISTDPLSPTDITGNIATTYPVDGTVQLNHLDATATVYQTGNVLHFSITGITVIVYGACGPFDIFTDIWGSNSNAPIPQAQCFICSQPQTLNTPTINLTQSCVNVENQNKFNLTLNNSPAQDLHVTFKIYGNDGDFVAEPDIDDVLLYTSDPITILAGQGFNSGPTSLPSPWCCIQPWASQGIFVVVDIVEFDNDLVSQIVINECATLPVKLRSFDANRNKSNVELKWVTEIEANNKGFYVERKLSNGGWEEVTFVASQAPNGNSNSPLTYVLTDLNNTKGISQYRLRQVDIDGKQAYSMIRSVRGEGQKSNTIIYPNPSGDGKVNIVFEGANSLRDVSLMDVSGKTLRQWKGVTNNNIHIANLNAGFYTVRIVNVETGEQVIEKFIVNKR